MYLQNIVHLWLHTMIVHNFCLPMELYCHMYKRYCIGRYRLHNEKVTHTAFITVLWGCVCTSFHNSSFITLERNKLWEIMEIKNVLGTNEEKLPYPHIHNIYMYIFRYTHVITSRNFD